MILQVEKKENDIQKHNVPAIVRTKYITRKVFHTGVDEHEQYIYSSIIRRIGRQILRI